MRSRIALALDVGGTKIAAACVEESGLLLGQSRIATDRSMNDETLFDSVVECMHAAIECSDVDRRALDVIGVGIGGPMARFGADVSPLNIPAWRSFPLAQRLEASFDLPATVDNDAKALALGELRYGAGRGHQNFIAMVVSTGVGGGLVVDGRLLHGEGSNAGHIGHVIVEPDGRVCACGARGCLEAEASGTAIAAITGRPAAEATDDVRRRVGTMVGRGVAQAVTLLDISVALVGGSVALGYGDVFFAAANAELRDRSRLSYTSGARIRPVGLGADGPLIGAAAVGFAGGPQYWGQELGDVPSDSAV